jgi:hypothetical protein
MQTNIETTTKLVDRVIQEEVREQTITLTVTPEEAAVIFILTGRTCGDFNTSLSEISGNIYHSLYSSIQHHEDSLVGYSDDHFESSNPGYIKWLRNSKNSDRFRKLVSFFEKAK